MVAASSAELNAIRRVNKAAEEADRLEVVKWYDEVGKTKVDKFIEKHPSLESMRGCIVPVPDGDGRCTVEVVQEMSEVKVMVGAMQGHKQAAARDVVKTNFAIANRLIKHVPWPPTASAARACCNSDIASRSGLAIWE